MKPISGSDLSSTHPELMIRSWSANTGRVSAQYMDSRVMSCLPALFIAVRTSCHALPLNASPSSGTTLSSATWIDFHPTCGARSAVAWPAANRHGIHPRSKQKRSNSSIASRRSSVGPIGSASARATAPTTR